MPLTEKGETLKKALTAEYGKEKGEQVLYAGKNKGTFTGIDSVPPDLVHRVDSFCDAVSYLCDRADSVMGSIRRDEKMKAELREAMERGDKEGVIRLREKIAMRGAGE